MASRPRAWSDNDISQVLATTVQQKVDLLGNMSAFDNKTVVRMIGRLHAFPNDLIAQVDGAMKVDIAVGVTSLEAFAAGIFPDPDDASEQPIHGWLYRTQMVAIKEHATGTTNEYQHTDTLQFDVKGSRKVDRGVLFLVTESNNITGATAFDVRLTGMWRCLALT